MTGFIDYLKPLIQWLHIHPELAALITFLIAMGESIAFFGLIVPGSVIMSAIGTLIGADVIPGIPTMIWAILGAIVGDSVSYYAGYRYTQHIRDFWPFSRYPQWITKAEDFFARHGGKSVFLGRFVGPMRPIIPVVAGMMRMRPSKFFPSCVVASTLWAPIYMLPGILIGAASQELAPETATRFVATILMLLFTLIFTAWLFRWLLGKTIQCIHTFMAYLWQRFYINSTQYWIKRWLTDPCDPLSHSQLYRIVLSLCLILALILLFIDITSHGLLYHLNQPIHQLFLNIHTTIITKIMVCISFIGYKYVLGPLVFVLVGWMMLQRYWRAAYHFLAIIVITSIIISINKWLIYSPEPDGLLYSLSGSSFPSGHAILAIVVYGFLAVLIARHFAQPRIKRYIYSLTAFACFLVMFSRIYLGAHWFTDVLAGGILGLLLVTLTSFSFFHRSSPRIQLPGLLALTSITLALMLTLQATHNYRELVQIYTPYWPKYTATQTAWWSNRSSTKPLFRPNRIGHPVQTMNIQWAGNLSDIEAVFTEHGWHIIPKLNLINLVNRVSSHDKEKRIPILPPLYLGQDPAFEASTIDPKTHELMLVRIWAANIQFSDVALPLWVGTISYQLPRHRGFWLPNNSQKQWAKLPTPIEDLSKMLDKQFTWDIIHYSEADRPKRISPYLWNQGVIYIKPTPPAPIHEHKYRRHSKRIHRALRQNAVA